MTGGLKNTSGTKEVDHEKQKQKTYNKRPADAQIMGSKKMEENPSN